MQVPITVGRRKTAIARVKLVEGSGKITINNKELDAYFPIGVLKEEVLKPFEITSTLGRYDVRVRVQGGGPTGQAGAIKLGIARSLVILDEDLRQNLRNAGLLTRDPRMVERKKYGQKKAR
ncbi:MAG TPA: 30S ribosomal protein S9, partial [Bacteroidetes bacterium]|nr:30S ribosomal protein S9 [Bacteroidota bacterium]